MSTLSILAWIFLGLGLLSFIVVYVDINMGRYQKMPIMNLAWPITALYSGPLALVMYFLFARAKKEHMDHDHKKMHSHKRRTRKLPGWVQIYISSTHCAAGCGLADIVSEIMIYWVGITILGHTIWASYFIDYGFALLFGFVFQYFNIAPMHPHLSAWEATKLSVKADVLSLTTFQVGMYAWLLAVHFIFKGQLNASSPVYWFMMQIGLTIGLITTYPVNFWLVKSKIKMSCAE